MSTQYDSKIIHELKLMVEIDNLCLAELSSKYFSIFLNLELVTIFPALNDKNHLYLCKIDISQK